MLYETDLPCSDCGGSLRERDVSPGDLAVDGAAADSVVVAECADCGARHYPDGTIRRLYDGVGPTATAGNR